MSDHTDALQTILAAELIRQTPWEIKLLDTPFVLVAFSPDEAIIVRGNFEPAELKNLAEHLVDAADEALDRPDSDSPVH